MRSVVSTDTAPQAIGPYSQAVKIDSASLVFVSGQIPLDPKTGEMVGETAADQCRQVMTNLSAVLRAAGSDLSKIAKTTIYLADMNDFGAVNEVYGEHFPSEPPARATIQVGRLPKDALVEIDAIALV
ncbi:reactive intermediate/imine deaminase [candidate division GN15 bacterium]|nr:reactive intermediate/imine deaminase [candidate division GN15 bacterium]